MANPVVYEWVKTNFPLKTAVPFHETQGMAVQQANLPAMWFTLEWDSAASQRLGVGRPTVWREYGTATAVFLGKAGAGPAALLAAAQAFADAMQGVPTISLTEGSGVTGTLRIENVSPPNGDPYEDGNWLVCSVSCAYTYDSVRGAVV